MSRRSLAKHNATSRYVDRFEVGFATMRGLTVATAAISLASLSATSAAATAYDMLHQVSPLDRSSSVVQTLIRVATVLAALALWRHAENWLARMTLLA